MVNTGKAFEKAVCEFAQRTNPNVTVLFDHKVPDRETGDLRQCDVWIETTVGTWPITIYVSCKDHSRKVDSGQMDTFIREKEARSASAGVIYSRRGFTKGALKKAAKNGASCCRLYENQPADIPGVLLIEAYACSTWTRFTFRGVNAQLTWGDILGRTVDPSGTTLMARLDAKYCEAEKQAVANVRNTAGLPCDVAIEETIPATDERGKCRVEGYWEFFKGKTEAHLMNGSYCVTSGEFIGTQQFPRLDMHAVHPGPGWERIDRSHAFPSPRVMVMRFCGNWNTTIESLWSVKLKDMPQTLRASDANG